LGAGSFATCGQFRDAPVLRCWGNNFASILVPSADAAVVDKPTGVTIPFGLDGGDLTTGGYQTCAVAADRSLFCWGFNVYGQAGPALVGGPPSLVPAAGAVDRVATGVAHTCTLADASIACFGWNQFGQLGQGTNDPAPSDGGLATAHPIPLQVMLPCP
jgi:alpha-tubulin suppressor-like RCC1 family protein